MNILDELKEMLRQIMNTKNELTFTLSGTGSAGMEAAFVNLVEPGDKVLIPVTVFRRAYAGSGQQARRSGGRPGVPLGHPGPA